MKRSNPLSSLWLAEEETAAYRDLSSGSKQRVSILTERVADRVVKFYRIE